MAANIFEKRHLKCYHFNKAVKKSGSKKVAEFHCLVFEARRLRIKQLFLFSLSQVSCADYRFRVMWWLTMKQIFVTEIIQANSKRAFTLIFYF